MKVVKFMSVKLLVGLLRWPSSKESACQCRRPMRRVSILGSGRSPGEGNGNPLWYSFSFKKKLFIYFNWRIITLQYFDGSAMYQHESAIGIHVTRPSWTTPFPTSLPTPSFVVVTEHQLWVPYIIHQTPTTPVFFPGESHGQRRLVGYSPWGCRVGHDWACMHTLLYLISRQSLLLSFDSCLHDK